MTNQERKPASAKLVNITRLSEYTGLPVRTLRSLMRARKIPYSKLGHRTIVFSPEKTLAAISRFEVREIQ